MNRFNKRSHFTSQALIHDQQESMSFRSLKKSTPKKKFKKNSKVVMEEDEEKESESLPNDIIDLDFEEI